MGEQDGKSQESSNDNPIGDKSSDTLSPKEAYEYTEEKGIPGKIVAEAFDVTPSWVSQRKSEYKEARQDGQESVSPTDFGEEELRDALGDEPPENNPYEHTCPLCGDLIDPPNTAGTHPCPSCGEELEWDESEL